MGGFCSKRSTVDNAASGSSTNTNGYDNIDSNFHQHQSRGLPIKVNGNSNPSSSREDLHNQRLEEPLSFLGTNNSAVGLSPEDDGIPRLSRVASQKSRSAKSKQVASAKVYVPCMFSLQKKRVLFSILLLPIS